MPEPYRDTVVPQRPGTPGWVKGIGVLLVAVVAVVLVVMLVGGGEHGPGVHAPMGDGSPSPGVAAATAAGAAGEPADAADAVRVIEVTTLDAMVFAPTSVAVSSGEVVTFVVTNEGQIAHEFTLGDSVMQDEHAAAMAHMPEGMAHDLPNSVSLRPGESKQLTWRFGNAGTLEYACHEPGHYGAGMRGQISVG